MKLEIKTAFLKKQLRHAASGGFHQIKVKIDKENERSLLKVELFFVLTKENTFF